MVRAVWLALSLLLAACGSRTAPQTVRPTGQKITIDDQILQLGGADTVRFGHLFEGETAVLPLVLVNRSAQPIVILRVERSCGCTTLNYENQPIKVAEERGATLSFDASGTRGWQFKLLKLYLAGATEPLKLYVEAEVE